MQIRQLHPMPKDVIQAAIDKASRVIIVEHNYQNLS
jgi:2-oxoglutarate ferredoxin oxidoreductase subunit alpha